MKKLTTPTGVFGPYASIEALEDSYLVDGAALPFTVVGQGEIGDVHVGDFPDCPVPPTREQLKADRQAKVDAITVTTAAGNTFDGDEVSQGRMARAVIALSAAPAGTTVNWVLHDNSVIQATAAELTEALALAGAAQAAVWVI